MNYDGLKRVRLRYRAEAIEFYLLDDFFFDVLEDFVCESGLIELEEVELSQYGLRLEIYNCGAVTLVSRDSDWRKKWEACAYGDARITGIKAFDAFRHVETSPLPRTRGKRGSGRRDQASKDALVAKVLVEWHRLRAVGGPRCGLRTAVENIAARPDLLIPSRWTHPAKDNVRFENTLLVHAKREVGAAKVTTPI